jgi:hypothetical protein
LTPTNIRLIMYYNAIYDNDDNDHDNDDNDYDNDGSIV